MYIGETNDSDLRSRRRSLENQGCSFVSAPIYFLLSGQDVTHLSPGAPAVCIPPHYFSEETRLGEHDWNPAMAALESGYGADASAVTAWLLEGRS